jgi:hypothetical protein
VSAVLDAGARRIDQGLGGVEHPAKIHCADKHQDEDRQHQRQLDEGASGV